jgi:hypothetical protein
MTQKIVTYALACPVLPCVKLANSIQSQGLGKYLKGCKPQVPSLQS